MSSNLIPTLGLSCKDACLWFCNCHMFFYSSGTMQCCTIGLLVHFTVEWCWGGGGGPSEVNIGLGHWGTGAAGRQRSSLESTFILNASSPSFYHARPFFASNLLSPPILTSSLTIFFLSANPSHAAETLIIYHRAILSCEELPPLRSDCFYLLFMRRSKSNFRGSNCQCPPSHWVQISKVEKYFVHNQLHILHILHNCGSQPNLQNTVQQR